MIAKIEGMKLILEPEILGEAALISDLYSKYSGKSKVPKEPLSIGGITEDDLPPKKFKKKKARNNDLRLRKCDYCGKVCRGKIGVARHIGSSNHKFATNSLVEEAKDVPGGQDESVVVTRVFN